MLNKLSKRRGNDNISHQEPLLCYAFLNELRDIILSKWDPVFEKYFGTKQRLEVFFDSLRLIRNKVTHSRNLTDTELSKFEAIVQYFYEFMAHSES
ncbi:SAV2148 family HEPN domain-containing protein [Desulfobacterales bacterium HSG2]|nr:SAV2148 family HEPN domain-containing protein [Desulfobacterales bacterium HSG2]